MAFENVRIVLCNPSHPGNIGAVARAMKTMRLDKLYLVEPKVFPHADATARAAGADDILAAAQVCNTLDEAIGDCHLIMGASARIRSLSCPVVSPDVCARLAGQENKTQQIALLFGREHSGLTNKEIDRCHHLIHIPSNEEFSSLNLASAVQIVAYELMKSRQGTDSDNMHADLLECASSEDVERFYEHLEQTLIKVRFLDPAAPRHVMRRLRRLFNRARPDIIELNVLRGMLTAMQNKSNEQH